MSRVQSAPNIASPHWRVRVDTGGTFTDCLAATSDGRMSRAKVLSVGSLRATLIEQTGERAWRIRAPWNAPDSFLRGAAAALVRAPNDMRRIVAHDAREGLIELDAPLTAAARPGDTIDFRTGEEAPLLSARLATGTPCDAPLPRMEMRLATTRGTNALLERRGATVALFVTRGFADLLRIGDQTRPDLFALDVRKPAPLTELAFEMDERLGADGSVVRALDPASVDAAAEQALREGATVGAVALLHADVNGVHERAVRDRLRQLGFSRVVISSDVAPTIGLLARAQTTVADAYLAPVMDEYLHNVERGVGAGSLRVMTSAGGLVSRASFRPIDGLLSGPAGGVAGALRAAQRAGLRRALAFDMGGTSTDVSRLDGHVRYTYEHEVAGVRIRAPALAIESVASGGGSVCAFDGLRLLVGPESAGASPGPACYGAGGPLTVTDVNVLLGRIDPGAVQVPIDERAAHYAAERTLADVRAARGDNVTLEELLESFAAIADEIMAGAARRVSVRDGFDPADYALIAFGGAGGLHACAVAAALGASTVLLPPDAGVLSAAGLHSASVERFAHRQLLRTLRDNADQVRAVVQELEREALMLLREEGVEESSATVRRRIVEARYAGQESALSIEWDGASPLDEACEAAHRAVFGHAPTEREVEIVSVRVVASSRVDAVVPATDAANGPPAQTPRTRRVWTNGAWVDAPVFVRDSLRPGERIAGPALLFDEHSAAFVPPGWSGAADVMGAVLLLHDAANASADPRGPGAARLELFTNRLRFVADEMGEALRRTALSTNVKDRLDFSCAVLDRAGELVVNAPHIPVHLGAMGVCVRRVREAIDIRPGDVVITNHPAFGGSHLPDVTLIAGVFDGDSLIGYTACRAHHAEIGGVAPGSMPAAATRLADEGVVIAPTRLIDAGAPRYDALRALLAAPPYPSRRIDENIADVRAQVAACARGSDALRALAHEFGLAQTHELMEQIKEHSDAQLAGALRAMGDVEAAANDAMDDGSPVRVRIHVRDGRIAIDFAGSAPVHPGSLNATEAIVRSAVVYALRLLVREDVPLNEGLMRRVDLALPRGMLNPAFEGDAAAMPAVAGGNVETSQRMVDVLLRALGLCADSQGTMNNTVFGNERYSHYETIGGGAGATPRAAGASGVHTHMTNTRITDVEVLERRCPVRVERFTLRRGSGGVGAHRGGDGLVRELLFLEPATLSMLTQRRLVRPRGARGAPGSSVSSGSPGRQRIVRASGETIELPPIAHAEMAPGDRLIIETPGGGAWGV